MRIFRDQTNLSANPALWSAIEQALSESEYFLLMASSQSAQSKWVKRELVWWLGNRSPRNLLIVVTDGELLWDEREGDYSWPKTTAISDQMRGCFTEEPLYIDLRWAKSTQNLSLRHSQFRGAVLDIAAPLLGKPKDELDGDDVREHRKTTRLASLGVIAVLVLAIASTLAAYTAIRQRNLAFARELAATARAESTVDPVLGLLLAVEAEQRAPTVEAERALRDILAEFRERTALTGHTREITSAVFSRSGKLAATASHDETARVWDVESGATIALLQGHSGPFGLMSVTFSPDDEWIATTGDAIDRTVRVWSARSGTLVATLAGHGNMINSAMFSSDGRLLVSASFDGTARLWDVKSGECRFELKGHTDNVTAAIFSPDDRFIVTASDDDTVRLWSTQSGEPAAVLAGHAATNPIVVYGGDRHISAAFNRDGSRLVTASVDGTARIWDVRTRAAIAVLKGHEGWVRAATFSPDGRFVATASDDGTARIWEVRNPDKSIELRGHGATVRVVTFSTDGSLVLTAGDDRTARVWDSSSGRELRTFRGHADAVVAAAFSPDDRVVLTASKDGTARLWDVPAFASVIPLRWHTGSVRRVAFSPDGRMVMTASDDGTARLWDATTGEGVATLRGHVGRINHAEFSRDGSRVLTVGEDNSTRLWLPSGVSVGAFRGESEELTSATLSRNGALVLLASGDVARSLDVATGRPTATFNHGRRIVAVRFSPDNQLVITTSSDGLIRLWNASDGALVGNLDGHTTAVNHFGFSPDGLLMFSSSGDGTTRIWSIAERKTKWILAQPGQPNVTEAALSADGTRVVTGSPLSLARVWDVATGRPLIDLQSRGLLERIVFSPDGRLVAAASGASNATIWDVASGAAVELPAERPLTDVAFSPDGRRLAIASDDNSARIFSYEQYAPVSELLAIARARAGRALTQYERQDHVPWERN